MPYISTVSDKTYRIETGENGSQRDVSIEGKKYSIDWRQIALLAADAKGHIATQAGRNLLLYLC